LSSLINIVDIPIPSSLFFFFFFPPQVSPFLYAAASSRPFTPLSPPRQTFPSRLSSDSRRRPPDSPPSTFASPLFSPPFFMSRTSPPPPPPRPLLFPGHHSAFLLLTALYSPLDNHCGELQNGRLQTYTSACLFFTDSLIPLFFLVHSFL